ncbi:class I SAM-dependent methyltransferase [Candidatus Woesearchaeota archaeon]|nr:class I SAM-dependent methyltransferase [Candidatus Woesearchaeota archaeon]
MIAVGYDEIQIPEAENRKYLRTAASIAKVLEQKYCSHDRDPTQIMGALYAQLPYFLHITDSDLREFVILDLACGSRTNPPDWGGDVREPWFCRALHHMEAHPIGVDIGELALEEFEHYKANLLEPDSLRCIPDNSVDFANIRDLFTSPMLNYIERMKPEYAELRKKLMQNIFSQLERILKPKGILFYNGN